MSTQLVQQILIEAKGNTAHVEAAIKQLRGELKGLKGESTGAAAAGSTVGNRYGSASIQIASAAENMARMGKVTGESAKMMLNQSAQMAFAFGPHGMLVGAIAITGLAFAQMFSRARKEAEETRRVIEKEIGDALSNGNLAAIGKVVYEQQKRVEEARTKAAAEAKRNRARTGEYDPNSGALSAPGQDNRAALALQAEEEALARLVAGFKERADAVQRAIVAEEKLKKAGEAAKDAGAEARRAEADAIQAVVARINDENAARKKAYAEQTAAAIQGVEEYYDVTARISDQLATELARQTKTLVDDIQLKYGAWIAEAEKVGNGVLSEQVKKARDDAIELQKFLEELDAQIADMDDWLEKSKKKKDAKSLDAAKFNAVADAIERSARGAIQLAEAFGLVDANTSRSLQAIAQIAVSLPQLKAATASGKWGGTTGIIASSLPVIGGIATVVDAFMSAGKAAREHAKALRESRDKLVESLRDRIGGFGLTDAQERSRGVSSQQKTDVAAMLDLLIQQKGVKIGTRADFLSKDQTGQRAVLTSALASADSAGVREALRAAIIEFDLIAEAAKKAAEQLEAENAAKRASFDQSLEERRLRLAGDEEAADALALLTQHEEELAAARKEGIYSAEQLAELQRIQTAEQQKAGEAAKKQREEDEKAKAQTAARRSEDLQSRINAADGESPAERALRVQIEHRRELEDAMADGADAATLALIQLAQAAGDAAAAQAALTAAQRDMEDLDVRLLRAQGKGGEADQLDFTNRQRRELEDAQAAGKDAAYLAKLRATQADELKQFLQGLVETVTGGGGGNVMAGAGTTVQSVGQAFSEGSANRVVSELSSIRIHTKETADEMAMLRSMWGGVSGALVPPNLTGSAARGGNAVRSYVTINMNGPINALDGGKALSATLIKEINRALGKLLLQANDLNGSAAIT